MRTALDGDSCSNLTASYLGNKTFFEAEKKDDNIELCSTTKIACVKWEATNIALGQYWFLICISLRPKWEAIPVLPGAHIRGQY